MEELWRVGCGTGGVRTEVHPPWCHGHGHEKPSSAREPGHGRARLYTAIHGSTRHTQSTRVRGMQTCFFECLLCPASHSVITALRLTVIHCH